MADFDDLFQLPPLEPLRPANRTAAAHALTGSAQIVKPLPQLATFARRADGAGQAQRSLTAAPASAAPLPAASKQKQPAACTTAAQPPKQPGQQGKPTTNGPTLQQLFARVQQSKAAATRPQPFQQQGSSGVGVAGGKENRKGLVEACDQLRKVHDDVGSELEAENAGTGDAEEVRSSEEEGDEDGEVHEDSSSKGEEDSDYLVSSDLTSDEGGDGEEDEEDDDSAHARKRKRADKGKGKGGGVAGASRPSKAVKSKGQAEVRARVPATIDSSVDPATEQRGARPSPVVPLSRAMLAVPGGPAGNTFTKAAEREEACKVRGALTWFMRTVAAAALGQQDSRSQDASCNHGI